MPKIKQSPKLPAEKRREQLLKAAHALFLKNGYRGTSTEQIARKAGVTKGALYHHFANKEDILIALLHAMDCHFEEVIDAYPDGQTHPIEFVKSVVSFHSGKGLTNTRNMMDFWVQALRIPRVRSAMEEQYLRFRDRLAAKVDPRFGRTPKARREVVLLLMAFLDGLAARSVVVTHGIDTDAQIQLLKRLLDCIAATSDNGKPKAARKKSTATRKAGAPRKPARKTGPKTTGAASE